MTKSQEEIKKFFERQETLLRLEEVHIIKDRYSGTYSGGKWVAVANYNEWLRDEDPNTYPWSHPFGDDIQAMNFWWRGDAPMWVGVGNTPDDALANLYEKNGISPT